MNLHETFGKEPRVKLLRHRAALRHNHNKGTIKDQIADWGHANVVTLNSEFN